MAASELSLVVLLSILIPASSIVSQYNDEIQQWRATFRKNYTSTVEELEAMKNLKRNMKEIEMHNIRFKAGLETYSRGLWELSDLSFEEKNRFLAVSRFNLSQVTLQGPRKQLKQGPTQVNWVEKGRVHEVQNQGKCGSCFAFAAVGVAEGVLLKNGDKTRLSVQQIVDCDKLNEGCEGGDPLLAFRFMKTSGITTADQYSYKARQGRCMKATDSRVGISSAVRETLKGNENRLRDIVATYGPVAVAINSAKSLTNYRSGVYTNPKCPKLLNHAVVLVGYGTDKKTKLDYWLVKNSWGTSWGESGYVKMVRNKGSICGIASEVIYAT